MFRKMRRFKQELSKESCVKILDENTNGVLSLIGDDGFPYGVPMSYVYYNDKIIFHCAKAGHKNDALEKCNKVSFTVVDMDLVKPKERTTYYKSVICFGLCNKLTDDKKEETLKIIGKKYSDGFEDLVMDEINKRFKVTEVFEIEILHMSGKQSLELLKEGMNK